MMMMMIKRWNTIRVFSQAAVILSSSAITELSVQMWAWTIIQAKYCQAEPSHYAATDTNSAWGAGVANRNYHQILTYFFLSEIWVTSRLRSLTSKFGDFNTVLAIFAVIIRLQIVLKWWICEHVALLSAHISVTDPEIQIMAVEILHMYVPSPSSPSLNLRAWNSSGGLGTYSCKCYGFSQFC